MPITAISAGSIRRVSRSTAARQLVVVERGDALHHLAHVAAALADPQHACRDRRGEPEALHRARERLPLANRLRRLRQRGPQASAEQTRATCRTTSQRACRRAAACRPCDTAAPADTVCIWRPDHRDAPRACGRALRARRPRWRMRRSTSRRRASSVTTTTQPVVVHELPPAASAVRDANGSSLPRSS